MIRRIVALWLVILIILPWAAPFPTCDLADLMGQSPDRHTAATDGANTTSGTLDDASTCLVPPVCTTAKRLKSTALLLRPLPPRSAPSRATEIGAPSLTDGRVTDPPHVLRI